MMNANELYALAQEMQTTITNLTRAVQSQERDLQDCQSLIKAYHEYAMGFNHVAGLEALRDLYALSVAASRLCADETIILKYKAPEEDDLWIS